MYSNEEIERKRQAALARKNQKAVSNNAANISAAKNVIPNNYNQQRMSSNLGNNASRSPMSNYRNQNVTPNASISNTFAYASSHNKILSKKQSNRFNPMGPTTSIKDFYGNCQQVCEATCSMLNNARFAVETSLFHPTLIDLFKTIPSRLYDVKTKIWNFHLNDYDLLQEKVISMKSDVIFKGMPNFLIKVCKTLLLQENETKKSIDLSQIDPCLLKSLYPFQKEGIEYGISKNGRCFIADDMGLGKTRQALGIAHYFKSDWPLIIVSPSSVRYQWSEAIIENIPSVNVQSIQHIITTKDYIEKCQILILSYDLLVKRIDELIARKFGVLICDESHYLKSGKTQRTKAVQRLATHVRRVIFLTGTPALSRPIELHTQIKILMPHFMSYQEFGMRYCAGVQTNYGWDFTGSSNLKELEILLKACCLIRRLKSEVMTQLPSKIRQKIILDPHLIKAATKQMEAASKDLDKKGISGSQKRTALIQYYSETSKAKEKAVCNYITDLIENQQKFLVFAHHQNMLDAICDVLTSKKIMFIRIDGKTNPEKRKHFVDTFQKNENILVAVLSITAANAGITMTAAQLVIFAELSWNPGILCQAEDRVHRIGQTDNVVIRYLLAKETADDHLWPAIQKKIDVLSEVGLDQNFDLNQADVENQQPDYSNQQKLDSFIESSTPASTSSPNLDASGNADLQTSTDSLKDLLDVDDDAFNDIDLDSIV